tara:strand:+ start:3033 stop:3590 length:558 start_codon:yes stop_codon:yes gene_type:complete
MKLAELRPLGTDKMQEMYGEDPDDIEENELERDPMADLDDGEPEMGDAEMDMDMGDDEMGMDAAPDGGAGAPGMVSVEDFMGALEVALEDVLGEPVSTEMADEMPADDDMEDDDAMDMDMDVEMPMGAEEEEEEEPPGNRGGMYENQQDLVNEVAKRVAKRLKVKNNKTEMVDALAERIMKRLTK